MAMSRKHGVSRGPKPQSQRQLRVGEEIRHALAGILAREPLRDPALQNVVLTVTEVRVSADLRNATAFVVPLGGLGGAESRGHEALAGKPGGGDILTALEHAAPYLRHLLAPRLRLRRLPTLVFAYDDSFDHAEHIAGVLARNAPGPRDA